MTQPSRLTAAVLVVSVLGFLAVLAIFVRMGLGSGEDVEQGPPPVVPRGPHAATSESGPPATAAFLGPAQIEALHARERILTLETRAVGSTAQAARPNGPGERNPLTRARVLPAGSIRVLDGGEFQTAATAARARPHKGFLLVEHIPTTTSATAMAFVLEYDGYAWSLVALDRQDLAPKDSDTLQQPLSGDVRLAGDREQLTLEYRLGSGLQGCFRIDLGPEPRAWVADSASWAYPWSELVAVLAQLAEDHGLRPRVVAVGPDVASGDDPVYVTEPIEWSWGPPALVGVSSMLRCIPTHTDPGRLFIDEAEVVHVDPRAEPPESAQMYISQLRATIPAPDRLAIRSISGPWYAPYDVTLYFRRSGSTWELDLVDWFITDSTLHFTRIEVGASKAHATIVDDVLRIDVRLHNLAERSDSVTLGIAVPTDALELEQEAASEELLTLTGAPDLYEQLLEIRGLR